jgi:hypothetical protein
MLDSHPQIAAPQETNLSAAAEAMSFTVFAVAPNDETALETSLTTIRTFVHDVMGAYAAREKKQRWCDKSLPSILHGHFLVQLFPEAQFLLLFRECSDLIASAIEACPWGFRGYGFERYVAANADNFVRGLALYWLDRTEALLRFEAEHRDATCRVRYEDLVRRSDATLTDIATFLELSPAKFDHSAAVFRRVSAMGTGDHKIAYTSEISTASVGRGSRVPIDMIPPPLLARVNELHAVLGYPALQDPRNNYQGLSPDAGCGEPTTCAAPLATAPLLESAERELMHRLQCFLTSPSSLAAPASGRIAVTVNHGLRDTCWTVAARTSAISQDPQAPPIIKLRVADTHLPALLSGTVNPATLLRHGFLRVDSLPEMAADVERALLMAVCNA